MEHIFSEVEQMKGEILLKHVEKMLSFILHELTLSPGISLLKLDKFDGKEFSYISKEEVVFLKEEGFVLEFTCEGCSYKLFLEIGPINQKKFYNYFDIRVSNEKDGSDISSLHKYAVAFKKKVLIKVSEELKKHP